MAAWQKLLSHNLRELRIHLCQKSAGSQGTRSFIQNKYLSLKDSNPTFPILVREVSGVEARAFARYPFGVERRVDLEGLPEAEVEQKIRFLVESPPPSKQ
ncbi:thioredoxin-like protein [Cladochytrium replicatum]|nr:thioredoxin-like protein [Cladochytrium replicatum]